jgi:hypothetical protein
MTGRGDDRWVRVWTRLKRVDPILVSARQSLEIDLGWKDRLAGLELWTLWEMAYGGGPIDGRVLLDETTALANPNRELAWITEAPEDPGPPGSRRPDSCRPDSRPPDSWWWCVVWDPEAPAPEHASRVCQRLLSRRTMELRDLVRAVVWGLSWSPAVSDPEEAARSVAETRTRGSGLLVNPHVQSYRLFCGRVPFPWWSGARSLSLGGRS